MVQVLPAVSELMVWVGYYSTMRVYLDNSGNGGETAVSACGTTG